ncbi:AAA family ATPase [Streptomyces hesseae]|uniref:Kinase n=1 Tax=Streptomyces hesseae TaxID=3075519 RepID=A0ABU2SYP0_9ACTN|nr:AAA family ATPase [Streptomyces sp. DSM 40473]MDT0453140.1 kinase [Streptomyces sp. DSM 40473]
MQRPLGSADTRLMVLRGNSGSGKTTTRAVRARYGSGLAIVSQDTVRREILCEAHGPVGATPGLIDVITRRCLDEGFHVVLEGIFSTARWGDLLRQLATDHRGASRFFYFDLSFPEMLRRHAARPEASEFGESSMREWYRPVDLLGGMCETLIRQNSTLEETVRMVMSEAGLEPKPAGEADRPSHTEAW